MISLTLTRLKYFGLFLMVVDHVGFIFSIDAFRIVGRLAFPIFVWALALGAKKTKNINKYVVRCLIFGLVSQPWFIYLFQTTRLNILFSFALYLIVYDYLKINLNWVNRFIVLLCACLFIAYIPIDYGYRGLALFLIFAYIQQNTINLDCIYQKIKVALAWLLAILINFNSLNIWGVLIYPFLTLNYGNKSKLNLYYFYPLHLILLSLWVYVNNSQ